MLSIAVPTVFNSPSLNELSMDALSAKADSTGSRLESG